MPEPLTSRELCDAWISGKGTVEMALQAVQRAVLAKVRSTSRRIPPGTTIGGITFGEDRLTDALLRDAWDKEVPIGETMYDERSPTKLATMRHWEQSGEKAKEVRRRFVRNLLFRLQLVPASEVRERERKALTDLAENVQWRSANFVTADKIEAWRDAHYPVAIKEVAAPSEITLSTGRWEYRPDLKDGDRWIHHLRGSEGANCGWTHARYVACETPEDAEKLAAFLRQHQGGL